MRTWETIDKSQWRERGEWDNEPDKMQWVDENTGFDCLIVRTPNHGALCGYVGVPSDHPCYGKEYDSLQDFFEVHAGLTFSGRCRPNTDPSRGICHSGNIANKDVWWLGFDCSHSGDVSPAYYNFLNEHRQYIRDWETYKNLGYVKKEVEKLARQIKDFRQSIK